MELPRLSELPEWSDFARIGLDTETRDPNLKTTGPSIRTGGYVAGVSFSTWERDGRKSSFYLPVRHEGGGNYTNRDAVYEYLRHQAKHFRGEIVGLNLQYDLDYLAELGVQFTPRFFRDLSVSGPLLLEPELERRQDKEHPNRWYWAEKFQHMNLNAQAERAGLPGKMEDELEEWARSRGLDPKADMWRAPAHVVAKYARQDAELPLDILALHEKEIERQDLQRVYDLESKLLPVLLKMRRRGVRVDTSKLDRIEKKAYGLEVKAMREVSRLSGVTLTPDDTNKSAALAMALKADGAKVPKTPKKISEKTGKETGGADSVTSDWLRDLGTPLADAILIAKKWNKVRTTFCQSIKDHEVNGRIHCTFNQLRQEQDDGDIRGAAFGRLSSSNPNLQQQPARDPEIGPLWRSIYLPDEGGEWACLDFSSQEPRMITHYAELTGCEGGAKAAEACRTDPDWDNHSMMAGFIFGDSYSHQAYLDGDKGAKGMRSDSKIIFLGRCYGMGGGKLCRSLGLPTQWVVRNPNVRGWEVHPVSSPTGKALRLAGQRPFEMAGDEGQVILGKFDEGVPYVKQLTKMVQKKAERIGYIKTLSGRRCRFPRHPQTGELWYAHKGLNRLIQGSSADQTKMAMVLADEAGIRMQLQVHDEIDLTIWDRSEAEQLNEIMVHAIELNVPTRCDIETGPTWGEIA